MRLFLGQPTMLSGAKDDKKAIQQQLADMGFPQFQQMQGWGGDEQAKADAMRKILAAIQRDRSNAQTLTGWLEGGQITPNMIRKVENLLAQTSGESGGSVPTVPNVTTQIDSLSNEVTQLQELESRLQRERIASLRATANSNVERVNTNLGKLQNIENELTPFKQSDFNQVRTKANQLQEDVNSIRSTLNNAKNQLASFLSKL